jgi:uncharacterized protein
MTATSSPIRATLDTNLFVSGLLRTGTPPSQLLRAWIQHQFRLVTSPALRAELADVLTRPKFARYHPDAALVAAVLEALLAAEHAVPLQPLPLSSRDVKDNIVLACALGGQVDYLVSGDQDLLVLDGAPALGSVRIVTARYFLDVLESRA